eukprot:COSAG02_NODE_429_length_22473_cov_38.587691_2_plen_169_part_00
MVQFDLVFRSRVRSWDGNYDRLRILVLCPGAYASQLQRRQAEDGRCQCGHRQRLKCGRQSSERKEMTLSLPNVLSRSIRQAWSSTELFCRLVEAGSGKSLGLQCNVFRLFFEPGYLETIQTRCSLQLTRDHAARLPPVAQTLQPAPPLPSPVDLAQRQNEHTNESSAS